MSAKLGEIDRNNPGCVLVKCLLCGGENTDLVWVVGSGWHTGCCHAPIHGPDQRPRRCVTESLVSRQGELFDAL